MYMMDVGIPNHHTLHTSIWCRVRPAPKNPPPFFSLIPCRKKEKENGRNIPFKPTKKISESLHIYIYIYI
jgi:hypothetical protein